MGGLRNAWERIDNSFSLSSKLIYLSMAFAYYSFYIFRPIFLKKYVGMGSDVYGIVASITAACSFAATSVWSYLADYTGRHKLIVGFITIGMAISFDLIYLVSHPVSTSGKFAISALIVSFGIFQSGIIPLVDFLTLKKLTTSPGFSKEMYGRQRVWATIGYPAVSYLVGALTKKYKMPILYLIVPISVVPFLFLLTLFGPKDKPKSIKEMKSKHKDNNDPLKNVAQNDQDIENSGGEKVNNNSAANLCEDHKSTKHTISDQVETNRLAGKLHSGTEAEQAENAGNSWIQLIKNPSFLFFLFAVFMNGTVRTASTVFLSSIWEESYGMEGDQIGYAAFTGVSLEIIIFFFGPFFSGMGNYWMLVLAQCAMATRSWLYWMLPLDTGKNYSWQVCGIELLKGVAFGFTHTAGVKLAMEAAPPGLEATAQAIYTSVYSQLPAIFSAAACGKIMASMGTSNLLLILAYVSTAAVVIVTGKYAMEGHLFRSIAV